MEKSHSQSSSRAQGERRRREQEARSQREQPAAAGERRAELAVERRGEVLDQDAQLRRAQARAARQQENEKVARPLGQLACQRPPAQPQVVCMAGQLATRATGQRQAQQP